MINVQKAIINRIFPLGNRVQMTSPREYFNIVTDMTEEDDKKWQQEFSWVHN